GWASAAPGAARARRRCASIRTGRWWLPSVAQILSGQPDEDRLERGLSDGEIRQREAGRLRGLDHARDEPLRAVDVQLDPVGDLTRPCEPLEVLAEGVGQLLR